MSAPKSKKIEIPEPEEAPVQQEVTEPIHEAVPADTPPQEMDLIVLSKEDEEDVEAIKKDIVEMTSDAPAAVEVPKEPEAPKEAPVTANVHRSMDVVDFEIVDIVSAQRGKRAVPSLIKFKTFSNNIRYVIVDVNDSVVKEAWAAYKAKHGNDANAEVFMAMMYKILDVEVPRMHRAVAPVDLD